MFDPHLRRRIASRFEHLPIVVLPIRERKSLAAQSPRQFLLASSLASGGAAK